MKEEIEAALQGKSEATKTYFRANIALLEEYVELMNTNSHNPQVWRKLQKDLSEKTEAMYAAYLKETKKKAFRPKWAGRFARRRSHSPCLAPADLAMASSTASCFPCRNALTTLRDSSAAPAVWILFVGFTSRLAI
jgi:hypothetical protein